MKRMTPRTILKNKEFIGISAVHAQPQAMSPRSVTTEWRHHKGLRRHICTQVCDLRVCGCTCEAEHTCACAPAQPRTRTCPHPHMPAPAHLDWLRSLTAGSSAAAQQHGTFVVTPHPIAALRAT